MSDRHQVGFRAVTRLDDARERLREATDVHGRTDTVRVEEADGRALAGAVAARRTVPHYRRVAGDGYAARAADTVGAGGRSPAVLGTADGGVGPNEATPVTTGEELPEGADAVATVEHVERSGGRVEVFETVAEGENVVPVGDDVVADQHLYDPGHRLRPSDLGLLRSAGHRTVEVHERPRVAVVPTGDELVEADPGPGEVVETDGLTVSRLIERWGGTATYRDAVGDDVDALREALARDADHDVVVTTGGSSVGADDLVPEAVGDLGEVLVHGIAIIPGQPAGIGVLDTGGSEPAGGGRTPVVLLPGDPVACIVAAVQLLRPAVKRVGGIPLPDHPTVDATLGAKVPSEPGRRTFAPVTVEGDDSPAAHPTRTGGAGALSSVALADGWVEVPESREGIPAGETVAVQIWEQR